MRLGLRSAIHRLCGKRYVSALYETRVGIKCANQLVSSDFFDHFAVADLGSVPAHDLLLCIDGLKDSHTLLGLGIVDSPHFALVKAFSDGADVARTDYLARAANGTLDACPPRNAGRAYVEFLRDSYERTLQSVTSGDCEPVKVFRVGGRCFIADGKHRAAVCALLRIDPRCLDVTPAVFDSFFRWVYRRMLDGRGRYEKHIAFFEAALKERPVCPPISRASP